MRIYEIMCVFAPQDEQFQESLTLVKEKLELLGANIQSEKDMGVKELAYQIQKHTHARYLYFIVQMSPEKAHLMRNECKLIAALLRILIIKNDKKRGQ